MADEIIECYFIDMCWLWTKKFPPASYPWREIGSEMEDLDNGPEQSSHERFYFVFCKFFFFRFHLLLYKI